jgi:thioesterase domain-containing protein
LTLFKSGEDALKVDKEAVRAGSRYSRNLGFVDNPWGEKARQLGRTTCRLDDNHWGMIKEHAFAHIGTAGEESDEAGASFNDGEAMNPHAHIELDW